MRLTEKRHSQNDDEYAHRQLKKRHHAVGKKIDAAHFGYLPYALYQY